SAVAKMQIKQLADECKELQRLIRSLDQRADKMHTLTETQEQRIDILAKMNSPENLRRDHMTLASIQSDIAFLKDEASRMHKLHNGVHPPVSNERKAT
ncbi:MAG: hypothetical protein ACPIE8_06510, partial [Henriciella sp.]